jgi:hypothetical protein
MIKGILSGLIFFTMLSCNTLSFSSKKIKEVKIMDVESNLTQTITDRKLIDLFFRDYLNTNEKYMVIFKGLNHIVFTYKNKELLIITNGAYIKYEGKTYRLKKNVNVFFKQVGVTVPLNE